MSARPADPEGERPARGKGGVLLLVLPAAGAAVLLALSRRGTYVSADSLAYAGTARNLVGGEGYTAPPGSPPVSNFPPLYPLVLAAFAVFGPDPLTVAGVGNPLLFGLTILVVGLLIRRLTGSLALALIAQLLVLFGVDFLTYHSAALSEPLFLLLALVALAAVVPALDAGRPGRALTGAACVAAAAVLTRYLGLAVVAAGAGGLALLGHRPRGLRRAAAYAAIALVPLVAWLAWAGGREGEGLNRSPVVHAPDRAYFVQGVREASTWVLPPDVPFGTRVLVLSLVVVSLVVVTLRRRHAGHGPAGGAEAPRLRLLLALFGVAYLLALVADRWLFDVTGRLDGRFLLPLHLVAVALALRALAPVDLRRSRLAVLGLAAVVAAQSCGAFFWLREAPRPGGFTAATWRRSPVIRQVRALPPTTPVFTNQVDALYFHTGRVADAIPEKAAFLTGRPNQAYGGQLRQMDSRLSSGAVLVYFTAAPARRAFLPSAAELETRLALRRVEDDEVAVLYRKDP